MLVVLLCSRQQSWKSWHTLHSCKRLQSCVRAAIRVSNRCAIVRVAVSVVLVSVGMLSVDVAMLCEENVVVATIVICLQHALRIVDVQDS